jgi:hypothetical protein
MANNRVRVDGSPTTVISVTAGNIATAYVVGNTAALSNTSQWPFGKAVLRVPAGFASAPAANAVVSLFEVPQSITGSENATAGSLINGTPAAENGLNSTAGCRLVGVFALSNTSFPQNSIINKISLPAWDSTKYVIKNDCGVTVNAGSGANALEVIITPITDGPG